jgi:hypothetical protein
MVVRKEIEVLPAEAKELKLGWTVHEVIGVAIVNPRAVAGVKALPRIVLTYKNTTITIRNDSVIIDGVMEEAAMALADHILKEIKRAAPEVKYFSFRAIEAYVIDGKILVNPKIQNAMDADQWALLKRETEKICNNLKAFM